MFIFILILIPIPVLILILSKTSAPLNAPFSYDCFEPLCGKESTLRHLCCVNSNSAMLIFCIVPSAKQTWIYLMTCTWVPRIKCDTPPWRGHWKLPRHILVQHTMQNFGSLTRPPVLFYWGFCYWHLGKKTLHFPANFSGNSAAILPPQVLMFQLKQCPSMLAPHTKLVVVGSLQLLPSYLRQFLHHVSLAGSLLLWSAEFDLPLKTPPFFHMHTGHMWP